MVSPDLDPDHSQLQPVVELSPGVVGPGHLGSPPRPPVDLSEAGHGAGPGEGEEERNKTETDTDIVHHLLTDIHLQHSSH